MHLTIKTVLISSLALLSLAAAGQGVVSVTKTSDVEQNVVAVAENWLPSVSIINEINTATRDVRVKLYRLVVASHTADALPRTMRLYTKPARASTGSGAATRS